MLQRGAARVYGVDVGYGQASAPACDSPTCAAAFRHALAFLCLRSASGAAVPQVHNRIRTDPRVVIMERTNLRHLQVRGNAATRASPHAARAAASRDSACAATAAAQPLPEAVQIATLDLSFISVTKARDTPPAAAAGWRSAR